MKPAKAYPIPSPAARFDPDGLDPSSQVCGTPGTDGISGLPVNGCPAGNASYSQASVSATCWVWSSCVGCRRSRRNARSMTGPAVARPMPKSTRPGYIASSWANISATLNGL